MSRAPQIKNKLLTAVLRRVEDFFIPPLCIVCDETLEDGGGRWLCRTCLDRLAANHTSRNACPRCAQNRVKHECGCEFAWDFPFEKVFSVYDYDDIVRAVAQHIKYRGKKRLAHYLGVIAAPYVPLDFLDGADIVIPVPLHRRRQRKRGYNQAEVFARGLLDGFGAGTCRELRTDLLSRVKNTGTQTALDRDSRKENLAGAFAASSVGVEALKGKTVILVDDIFTTGATVEACTDELLRAGCSAVRALSLGRGVAP